MWVKLKFWLLGRLKHFMQMLPWLEEESFVVLSAGRSGSTLLMQYLRSHPGITCELDEPLNPDSLSRRGLTETHISPSTLVNYLMAQLLSWRKKAGFKIFGQQLEFYRVSLGDLLAALNDPPVIVLFREDVLATYVSLELAFKTNEWFSMQEKRELTQIEVDPVAYRAHAEGERKRWRETVSAFSRRLKRRVLLLSYEELNADKEGSLKKVFSFLRLPYYDAEAYSRKQNTFSVRQTIANYDEIAEELNSFSSVNYLTKEYLKSCMDINFT